MKETIFELSNEFNNLYMVFTLYFHGNNPHQTFSWGLRVREIRRQKQPSPLIVGEKILGFGGIFVNKPHVNFAYV